MNNHYVYYEGERGTYLVKEKLDEGGMGIVWIGENTLTGEEVVLKIAKPLPVAISKLKFEIEILRSISHRHIVKFIDSFYFMEQPVLVEEYCRGDTIYDFVKKQGTMDEEEVRTRLVEILLAIDLLHSRNIIHRDIKPKNIIISDDIFYLKLIDLGTAVYYNIQGVKELVFSGGGYTAPEQYIAYALPQSDIWAVMALGFYMLTGKDPVIAMQGYYPRHSPPSPPNPRIFNPWVSRELAEIIMRGMAWNALDRFSTPREAIDTIIYGSLLGYGRPVLEIMGIVIPIETDIVVVGRREDRGSEEETQPSSEQQVREVSETKISYYVDNKTTIVEVADPYKWISRKHFELRYIGQNKWCIRDLGSTNRTAIMTKKGIFEIWNGRGVASPCYELEDRTIILVAYGSSLSNPPYLTAVFRTTY